MDQYKRDKVKLSELVVIKRINRFLAEKGHKLHKTRAPRGKAKKTETQESLGIFYIVSDKRVVEKHVDLEDFARKHEIIAPYEVCARE